MRLSHSRWTKRAPLVAMLLAAATPGLGPLSVLQAASRLGLSQIAELHSTLGDAEFGQSVAFAGRLVGNQASALVVGAPADSTFGKASGRCYVYLASASVDTLPDWDVHGEPGELLGFSIAPVGDVDQDGYGDFLIGAPAGSATGAGLPGRAILVFGGPVPSSFRTLSLPGFEPGSRFGYSVAELGDINGDGYPDFAVGAPLGDGGRGEVAVYYGGPAVSSTPAYWLHGENPGDEFGNTVAGPGAVHGTVPGTILVGAPCYGPSVVWQGKAYLFDGGAVPDTLPHWTRAGSAAGDNFGWSVDGLGDVNGDGRPDFMVGAPGVNAGLLTDAGQADLFLGRATLSLTPDRSYVGSHAGDQLGYVVRGVGDLNGDGFADFAAGAIGAPGGIDEGQVWVLAGSSPPPLSADTMFSGQGAQDQFGYGVSNGGLWRGEQLPDFAIGAYNRNAAGAVQVFGHAVAQSLVPPGGAPGASEGALTVRAEPLQRGGAGMRFRVRSPSSPRLRCSVLDVSGRVVRTLWDGPMEAGPRAFDWDGRAASGVPAPSGLYWATVTDGLRRASTRFLRIR